jgi:hypothetical protein
MWRLIARTLSSTCAKTSAQSGSLSGIAIKHQAIRGPYQIINDEIVLIEHGDRDSYLRRSGSWMAVRL